MKFSYRKNDMLSVRNDHSNTLPLLIENLKSNPIHGRPFTGNIATHCSPFTPLAVYLNAKRPPPI